jgi:solute carrier family 50 protein (sugar transporter)
MLSASEIILEYVCPGAGTVTATIMWLAPWKDIQQAKARGRLGDLNPLPWAFMLGNTIGWVTYGILKQNLFILFANAPGVLLSIYYNMQAVKMEFHEDRSTDLRKSIVVALNEQSQSFLVPPAATKTAATAVVDIDEQQPESKDSLLDYAKIVWQVAAQERRSPAPHEKAVMFLVTVWIATISLVSFADSFSHSTRENVVGAVVICNLIFFYGAPLSTISTVVKTRNSRSIHVPTMITNTATGVFWGAYGIAVSDYLIAGPNLIGAFLGGVQILLILLFPKFGGGGVGDSTTNGGGGDAIDGQPSAKEATAATQLVVVDEEKPLEQSLVADGSASTELVVDEEKALEHGAVEMSKCPPAER